MASINIHINHWKKSAKRNWQTAKDLFKTKHYDACLFFCHLTVEKLLKGLVVKQTKKAAPFTHDLIILVNLAELDLLKEQKNLLRTINTFNISARYDDAKLQFYKKATRTYTVKYLEGIKDLVLWLQKKY